MTYKLVLLRHGQSAWNKTNQFTGWVDVPLTEQGVEEAKNGGRLLKEKGVLPDIVFTSLLRRAINTANIALDEADRLWIPVKREAKNGGRLLKEKGVLPDIVFTSLLRRAINTANIALDEADRLWIPVKRDWRLNERHYGALQGKNKSQIREEYGDEKFMLWRRSYGTPPPEIDPNDEYAQNHDPRYAGDPVPEAECLAEYGDEKFMLWRRSYGTPPPEIDPNDEYAQNHDPRYAGDPVPEAECLADVVARVEPYWESDIIPELTTGKTVLIAAHGNSLRATATRCARSSRGSTA